MLTIGPEYLQTLNALDYQQKYSFDDIVELVPIFKECIDPEHYSYFKVSQDGTEVFGIAYGTEIFSQKLARVTPVEEHLDFLKIRRDVLQTKIEDDAVPSELKEEYLSNLEIIDEQIESLTTEQ